MMWSYLKLVRIYTKPKGQLPDYSAPVVLMQGKSSVEDFCNKIHRAILAEFKYALVWVRKFLSVFLYLLFLILFFQGASVKHLPQKVGKEHLL